MKQFHYNYIYTGDTKWGEVFFSEIFGQDYFKYFRTEKDNLSYFQNLLLMANYSRKVKRLIGQPFKRMVYKNLFYHDFGNELPVSIIFQGNKTKFFNDYSFIKELRKRNPKGKLVLYMIDIVSKNKELDPEYVNTTFDLIVTYDKKDADKYGWVYVPTPFSKVELPDSNEYPNTDVYFCGSAKERLNELVKFYDLCNGKGIKCDFYLPDKIDDGLKCRDGIHYSTTLKYKENLGRLSRAKCNLELMQEGAVGFTPRLWEAIMYDKHLVSNNKVIKESPYYYEKGIHFIDEGIDAISEKIQKPIVYPKEIKALLSPKHLLRVIDQELVKI